MQKSWFEVFVGLLVIFVAGFFLYYAVHRLERQPEKGYALTARFSNIDGLAPGSAVRVSGVKIGTVAKITLEPETFLALVHLQLNPKVSLPTDTVASVNSQGLLGEKYMALEPGSDDERLKPGGTIVNTQSSASIERLLGQVIFSLQNLGKNNNSGSGSTPASAPATSGAAHP